MSITKDDVLQVAPECASLPDGDFTWAIGEAEKLSGGDGWGDSIDLAQSLMAAHLLVLFRPALQGGPVIKSERVGNVSRTYAVADAANDGGLEATSYGLKWKSLARLLMGGPVCP